ncbi:uncharacterized protein LOC101857422 isoform X2 [Aplysia californica]|uniref:Uncharacterized protein LOC101857422 isoform X2 n=1 Tax=Aplysia californica TaxID=6500 RepID=A0ABM0JV92_APLCA|nr:uncharacterized protein LOC101857422 isoform X2 [Aplysia californica]
MLNADRNKSKREETTFPSGYSHIDGNTTISNSNMKVNMKKELHSCCERSCADTNIYEDVTPGLDVFPVVKTEPGPGSSRSRCSSDSTDKVNKNHVAPDIGSRSVETVVKEESGSNLVQVPCNITDDIGQTVENKFIDIVEIKEEPLFLFPEEERDQKTNAIQKRADVVKDEPQFGLLSDQNVEENDNVKQEVFERECGLMLDRSSQAGEIHLQISDVRSLVQSSNPDNGGVASSSSTSVVSADPALLKCDITNSCSADFGCCDQDRSTIFPSRSSGVSWGDAVYSVLLVDGVNWEPFEQMFFRFA